MIGSQILTMPEVKGLMRSGIIALIMAGIMDLTGVSNLHLNGSRDYYFNGVRHNELMGSGVRTLERM